jgi:hypothetical protein
MSSENLSSKDGVKSAPFPNRSNNNISVDTLSSTPLLRYLTFPYITTDRPRESVTVPGIQSALIAPRPGEPAPLSPDPPPPPIRHLPDFSTTCQVKYMGGVSGLQTAPIRQQRKHSEKRMSSTVKHLTQVKNRGRQALDKRGGGSTRRRPAHTHDASRRRISDTSS